MSADGSWSYGPEEDDRLTHLFRREAALSDICDALVASLSPADAGRELISFRHQLEFRTRRRARPVRP